MRKCLALFLLLAASTLPVRAETVLVRPDGSGDYPTIQAAIGGVAWGSVIELASGTFTGPGNRDLHYFGKPITIRSQSGNPDDCILDCQGTPADPHRGFLFDWTEGPGSALQGVTILNGCAEGPDPPGTLVACGGGILISSNASPSFIDVVIRDCTAKIGGGACIWPGSPTFTRCRFEGNTGWWGSGGGIWSSNGSPTMIECVFEGNVGYQAGGGASCRNCPSPALTIQDCQFLDNQVVHGYGAGLDIAFGTSATVAGCLFAGNSFQEWGEGGGLTCETSDVELSGCTFYGNEAPYGGGGIYSSYGTVTVRNTIIAFNASGGSVDCPSGGISLTCSDVYGNAGGDWIGCIADQLGVEGNIALDPLFCSPASGNFRLQEGSPCAPFSPPNPQCDLIGAYPVGCEPSHVPADPSTPMIARGTGGAFPNPFGQSTTMRFSARGADGLLFVSVVDASGRQIRRFQQMVGPSSLREVRWDGRNDHGRSAGSGVYLLRVQWREGGIEERVVLIR